MQQHKIIYLTMALTLLLPLTAMDTSSETACPEFIILISADNTEIIVPTALARLAQTCTILIVEHRGLEEPLMIPLSNIDTQTLQLLFGNGSKEGYLKLLSDHLADYTNSEYICAHISDAISADNLSDSDNMWLFLAANHMDIPILTKVCATAIGKRASNFWEIGEEDNDGRIQKTLRVKEDSSGDVIAPELKALIASTLPVIRPPRIFNGHTSEVHSVAFAPDGNSIASGSADRTVRIWDIRTDQPAHTLNGHSGWVNSVAFAPDGNSIASGSFDRTVRIWDIRTDQPAHTLNGHSGWVNSVAFAPDSNLVASGSFDRTVRIWDIRTAQLAQTLNGHTGPVYSVAFAPDSNLVASGSDDKTVRIWDIRTGRQTHIFNEHAERVCSVAFDPNGNSIASGSCDQTVRIWDLRTGKQTHTFNGHAERVRSVAFAPDSNSMASGSDDQIVRLWDIRTGRQTHILEGHTERVHSVAFAPDSNSIASGSYDNTVRLWPLKESYPALLFGPKQEVDDIIASHIENTQE